MELDRQVVNLEFVLMRTAINKEFIDQAVACADDLDAVARKQAQLCRACHYMRSRIGGSVTCHRECGIPECRTIVHSGNACVDVVCGSCAETYKLCCRCGGDREGKMRRKLERKTSGG